MPIPIKIIATGPGHAGDTGRMPVPHRGRTAFGPTSIAICLLKRPEITVWGMAVNLLAYHWRAGPW
jgi:hypothetical protein